MFLSRKTDLYQENRWNLTKILKKQLRYSY